MTAEPHRGAIASDGGIGDPPTSSEAQRLHAVLATMQDPYVLLQAVRDDAGTIVDFVHIDANHQACATIRMPREQLLGKSALEVGATRGSVDIITTYKRTVETGEPFTITAFPFLHRGQEGRGPRYYDVSGVKIDDGLSVKWRDVTDRVEAAEALRRSEQRYRILAENASDVVVLLGNGDVVEWVSPSVTRVLGLQPEDVLGRDVTEALHPDDRARFDLERSRHGDGPQRYDAYRVLRSDGSVAWISAVAIPALVEEGERRYRVVSIRDVTESVTAQALLEESETRFRLAMERSAIGMCLVSPDGRFEMVNDALCSMLGRPRDDLLGRTWQELTHEDDLHGDLALVDDVLAGRRDHYRLLKRYLHRDGTVIFGDLSVGCVRDDDGAVHHFVSQIVDVTAFTAARAALAESEKHYRLLAENASDVVYETDRDAVIQWVSPSVERVLGWRPEDMVGRVAFEFVDVRYSEDPDTITARLRAGRTEERHRQSFFTAEGGARWMSVDARPILDDDGEVVAGVISLHDIHEEVINRRAYDTVTAVNALLVRVHDENALLSEMCEIAVDRGGYLFSWYGRATDDAEQSVAVVTTSVEHRDYLEEVAISWGPGPNGSGPTGRCLRTGTTQVVDDFTTEYAYGPWREAATRRGFRSSASLPVLVDGELDGAWMVYAPEAHAFGPATLQLLEEMARQLGYGLGRLRDARRLIASLRQGNLLSTAIDQAAEAIVVTDPDGTILYVNPATTRSSGYTGDELLGRTPKIFRSGLHDDRFFEAIDARLASGAPWQGVMVNRRKNGELYEEDVAIAPVHDDDGGLMAYVEVKRDLTPERRLEAVLSREQRDRDALVSIMESVRPTGTIEATAAAFCQAACRIDRVEAAMVLLRQPNGELVTVGVSGPIGSLVEVGAPAPTTPGRWLDDFGEDQTHYVDFHAPADPVTAEIFRQMRAAGFDGVAVSPIHWQDQTIGLISLASTDPNGEDALRNRLGMAEELGLFAGTLFGAQATERGRREATRDEIRGILERRGFQIVYQPVVDLESRSVCGYEALTRFADGIAPDAQFLRAWDVGLGSELEAACARAAIDGAAGLPPELWLSVNFSPEAVLDGTAAAIMQHESRHLVIEITEHAVVQNYLALREAVAQCRDVWLSVDDAGAGFASLRHILELQPHFVKLDLGLVRDVDSDYARQSLAAGLRHFATRTGILLIAEGVETEAEATTLRALGIHQAQGFLFGRPGPLP